jgi:hypothetical protein
MAPAAAACHRQNAARRAAAPRQSLRLAAGVLSRVHWVRPELVAEVKFLTWTADNLLRQVVYEGLREDKAAAEVRRPIPAAILVVAGRMKPPVVMASGLEAGEFFATYGRLKRRG